MKNALIVAAIICAAFLIDWALKKTPATPNHPTAPVTAAADDPPKTIDELRPSAPPQLQIIARRGAMATDDIAKITGEVRNSSNGLIESVKPIITVYDSHNQILATQSGYLEIDPLRPGQTSPFSVNVDGVRVEWFYKIEFATFSGEFISSQDISNSKN